MNAFSPIFIVFDLLQLVAVIFAVLACLTGIVLIAVLIKTRFYFTNLRKRLGRTPDSDTKSVAFFHPYCNAGGGGEKVLWWAVDSLAKKYPDVQIAVYTGDIDVSPQEIIRQTYDKFNIKLPNSIQFFYLHKRSIIEAKNYPCFTLLAQNVASLILGMEALKAFLPDVFIDTAGYPFTLPLFSYLAQCKVASYVHYPIVTSDMIKRVASRQIAYNNRSSISRNPLLTFLKILYYKLFSMVYSFVGKFSDVVMVNSSWTEEHINALWNSPLKTHRLYPPCDTADLQTIPLTSGSGGKIKIISVSQFRPEKDHPLQLKSLYSLRQLVTEDVWDNIELVLIGSTRNAEDETRVQDMKNLSKYLSLEKNVSFKINISYQELRKELETGLIGLHTMWNEHFGISVVECMAAGLIMVAHNSGGPKMDIIEQSDMSRNGFLASTEEEYAKIIALIIKMPDRLKHKIRECARSSVNRFSIDEFTSNFLRAVEPLFVFKNKKDS